MVYKVADQCTMSVDNKEQMRFCSDISPAPQPTHEMANALGLDHCVTLPMFHAFTGCDTVSCFGSRGKRTAWGMGSAHDEVTPAFCGLAATPETVDDWLCPLERLLVLLYDCTNSPECVNGVQKQFTQKGRAIVLRHKQYFSSTQSGLLAKPVTVGHRR